ncbi:MAG: hypothetical protein KAW52_00455 [candidate division Zixibacteria bacterium]|nr:hypothetical protein [candidate division Zixibacteria bacterium]
MNEDEKTEGTAEVIDHGPAKKEFRPSRISVTIREAESHYLVSFGCGSTRVFHNVEELLVAIEVEINRLRG